ncbi:protein LOW PSII ACCUMULATION 1, chloroplastic [Humulus lupulus]|uniref:protein LOW PSII ACCUMULATION 1, chloroplastic n=1 Tax=Humulus lupulus TaxID=3486 RepID=UPI002B4175C5|nr:protein LOW PSII ACCUMULATION 1, chloroplastic [Humulus lupulus]
MASAVAALFNIVRTPNIARHKVHNSRICSQIIKQRAKFLLFPSTSVPFQALPEPKQAFSTITCSATDKPTSSSEISSTARIRSEVLTPFRSVRMFFYVAFIASAGLGGLIATTQLIGALTNPSRAAEVTEISKGLAIDVGAVLIFAFLYSRENNAKNAQLARLSREESLSNLKLRVDDKRVIPLSSLRGIARLVICAGPESYISESFRLSQPFTEGLLERGVLVVPFSTDGNVPKFEYEESDEKTSETTSPNRKKLWQLRTYDVSAWSEWLNEQKKMANVSPDSPVYLSLRLDGRVRGSGVGYPPWNAFVAQLPPVKGLWSGLLDGMDGRVL